MMDFSSPSFAFGHTHVENHNTSNSSNSLFDFSNPFSARPPVSVAPMFGYDSSFDLEPTKPSPPQFQIKPQTQLPKLPQSQTQSFQFQSSEQPQIQPFQQPQFQPPQPQSSSQSSSFSSTQSSSSGQTSLSVSQKMELINSISLKELPAFRSSYENQENLHRFNSANSKIQYNLLPEFEQPKPKIADGWELYFGNIYRTKHPEQKQEHICDFTCSLAHFDERIGYFVCRVSGKPSRCFSSDKRRVSSSPTGSAFNNKRKVQ